MNPRLPRKPRVPAIVLATAVGVGCGGKVAMRIGPPPRIGPPSCAPRDSTHVQVLDEQNQRLASVAVHVEVGGQEQILTSGPNGEAELVAQLSDDTKITAPGFEVVTRSWTSECYTGSTLVLVLRRSTP